MEQTHVSQRMNRTDFDDALTFPLAPQNLLGKCLNNYCMDCC